MAREDDKFKFTRDFRSILWKETLWFNALRAACAGLVWAFIFAFMIEDEAGVSVFFQTVLGFPLLYFIVLFPTAMVAGWLSFIPFVGLFAYFIAFMVAVGDPIVCLLYRFVPQAVPVENPSLFSLQLTYWVLSPLPPGPARESFPL